MNKAMKIVTSIVITCIMVFIISFILKYKELLTAGEISSIIIIGMYATFYHSNKLEELEAENE